MSASLPGEVASVGGPDLIGGTSGHKLFLGELADRLQHRKSGPPRGSVGDQQRLAHQRIQQIQHGVVVGVVESGHRAGALEIEPTREHRTPLQQRLLRVVEVVVGPCHGVAQGLVAFRPAPGADQQPEPLIKTITHLARRHRRHPRNRQLDRQRDAVQATANFHHRARLISCGHPEARGHTAGAFDEQIDCGRVDSAAEIQRGHRPHLLVGDRQPFAAGGHEFAPSPSAARMASIRSAAASSTCSQLSNTNNRTLPSNAAATLSATLLPGCWVMPSTAATASGTAAGSATAANSKTHTPSGKSSVSRAATSVARRVLPTPPTPVNVTSR